MVAQLAFTCRDEQFLPLLASRNPLKNCLSSVGVGRLYEALGVHARGAPCCSNTSHFPGKLFDVLLAVLRNQYIRQGLPIFLNWNHRCVRYYRHDLIVKGVLRAVPRGDFVTHKVKWVPCRLIA